MTQGGHNKILGPGRIFSASELAEVLGISYASVQSFIARGAPIRERGGSGRQHQIAAGEFVRWLVHQTEDRDEGGLLTFEAARTRKMNADAKIAELELAEKRREVVEVAAVVAVVTDMLGEVKAKLLALPSKLAHRLAATGTRESVMKILEVGITDALNELTSDDVVNTAISKK